MGTSVAPTGSSTTYAKLVLRGNTVNNNEAYFALGRGSAAVNGQSLGSLWFIDNADGQYARIDAHCDGTPGTSDFPGRLSFWTTADGASGPTERVRIDSAGVVNIQYGAIVQAATLGRGPGNVSTNTIFGDNALRLNTTAGQNTAVGYETLYQTTSLQLQTQANGHLRLLVQTLIGDLTTLLAGRCCSPYANTTGSYEILQSDIVSSSI